MALRAGGVDLIRGIGLERQTPVKEGGHITELDIGFPGLRVGEREIGIQCAETVAAGINLKRTRQGDAERVVSEQSSLRQAYAIGLRTHRFGFSKLVSVEIELGHTFGIGQRCHPAFGETDTCRNAQSGAIGGGSVSQ